MIKLEKEIPNNEDLDSISCDKIPINTSFTGSFSYNIPNYLYIKLRKYKDCISILPVEFNIYKVDDDGTLHLCTEKVQSVYNKMYRYKPVNIVMKLEKSNK